MSCARSTPRHPASRHLQLHAPTLDDVFLAKTGRTLEGAAEGGARGRRARAGRRVRRRPASGRRPCAPLGPAAAAPAREDRPVDRLPAVLLASTPAGSTPRRDPRLPDRLLLRRSRSRSPFMQGALFSANSAGTDLARDIETGFLNRLALTPMRGVALMAGQLAGVVALGLFQAVAFVLVGWPSGTGIAAGVNGALVIVVLSLGDLAGLRLHRGVCRAAQAARARPCRESSRSLFAALFLSSMCAAAQPDRDRTGSARSPPGTRSPTCSRRSGRW